MVNFWRKKEMIPSSTEQSTAYSSEELSREAFAPEETKIDFRENLKNLSEAIQIQGELGGQLSLEDVIHITGMQPEDFRNFLSGQEIAIKANGGELVVEIESLLKSFEKEEKAGSDVLRNLANNPAVRASFMALMLFAKFTPEAKGAQDGQHNSHALEITNEVANNNAASTYHPELAEFYEGKKEVITSSRPADAKPLGIKFDRVELPEGSLIKLEVANYFDTDSDRIPPEIAESIKDNFQSFLSSLNSSQLEKLDDWQLKVSGHSDERSTNNWPEGNYGLTKARLAALAGILGSAIDDFDFSGWPAEKVEKFKAKTIMQEPYISSTGTEKGTKYITDLVNPVTGNLYTVAETAAIKQSDPGRYKKLLDDCRQVSFEIAVQASLSENIAAHSAFIVVKDISRSMIKNDAGGLTPTDRYLAEYFQEQTIEGPSEFQFAVFAGEGLIDLKKVDGFSAFAEEIKNKKETGDGRKELALGSAIEALKQTQPKAWRDRPALGNLGDSPFLLITTDEALQDVTYHKVQELKKLAEAKKAEVIFGYCDDKGETLFSIDRQTLEAKVEVKKAEVFADPKIEGVLTDACSKEALKKMTAVAEKKASDAEKIAVVKDNSVNTYRERWLAAKKRLDQLETGTKTVANLKATERVLAEMKKIEDDARIILADVESLRSQAASYRASIAAIKDGADKYNKTGDKQILLHPYFAELSLGGNDPMGLIVDRSEFKQELSLKRN